jgi:DNA-binding NtrC family response regulator
LQAQAAPVESPEMPPDTITDIRTILAERQSVDFRDMMMKVEKRIIEAALELSDGSISDAARMLQLKRTTLIGRMQATGLRPISQT